MTACAVRTARPAFTYEEMLWLNGIARVAGIDEVGRGPLAGPVVAAAVVFPPDFEAGWTKELQDSKLLRPRKREELAGAILGAAEAAIGVVPSMVVDRVGIARATRLAMVQAISRLPSPPMHLLIDAFPIPESVLPQTPIIHGDRLVRSIAAASIVAKVYRDRMMEDYGGVYPGYDFPNNKGYATSAHLAALQNLGPTPIHRRSFAPVSGMSVLTNRGDDAA
jgi:ribonuclease HII